MVQHSPIANSMPIKFPANAWALIVDDHPMFCDALELTLRSICDFASIRSVNCIADAAELIGKSGAPALVVLDLNLPDVTGFDGLARILTLVSPTPVVVVSSLSENRIITSALNLGASGFVPKHSPRPVFKAALEAIQEGNVYFPDNFVASEIPDEQNQALRALSTLTPQQARILELISDGLLNKQIAHELSIAEATVKAHVTAIMRKLGVNNRTQAVQVANAAKFTSILPENVGWQ